MFKYKQLIVGIILGASITTATGAYAAVGDKLEAIVTQFNFVVNGKSVVIDAPIVTIADSSYLPVRALSNMLGYDITYKADSRTIELNGAVVENVYGNTATTTEVTPLPPTQTTPQLPTTKQLETVTIDGFTYFSLTDYVVNRTGESKNWVYDDQNHRYIYLPSNTTIDLNVHENCIIQNGVTYLNIKFLPNN